jgi:two-component sensor histidine kinase
METILRQPAAGPDARDSTAEAHHRIANSLTLLVSMVRMSATGVMHRQEPFAPLEVRQILDGVAARIGTISQLHRLLSRVPFEGVADLGPHLKEVTDALVSALASGERQVRVAHGGHTAMVFTRQVQPVILILCEAFINAMKYARPDGGPLAIEVDCRAGDDGRVHICVCDDGAGLPAGLDPRASSGLGFRVMRSLAAEIDAELLFKSTPQGLCVSLTLPPAGS